MARIRADYVFGTTTAALGAADTTLSSAELSRLPAVTSPDVAAITLHDGADYEIVHVTAHTAGATTATIVRGQEDSAAQAWASDVSWTHGATADDLESLEPLRSFHVADYGAAGDGATDDTTAVQAAIDAAAAAGGGTVVFDAKTYLCNGPLRTDRNGNSVLALPVGTRVPIRLVGVTPTNNCDPRTDTSYTIIKTTKTGLAYSGTDGVPSLLGGPTDSTWVYNMVSVINICFWLPANPTLAGVDLRRICRIEWDGSSIQATNVGDIDYAEPTSVYAFGLRTPEAQNYNTVLIKSGSAHGLYAGIVGSVESLTLTYWVSKWCRVGWGLWGGGHGGVVDKFSSEYNTYHLSGWSETAGVDNIQAAAGVHTEAQVSVGALCIEDRNGSEWYATTEHIHDPTNKLSGVVFFDRLSTTGPASTMTINGAANLETISLLAPSFGSGGGGSGITVQDEGGTVATGVTQLDFIGAGVSAATGTGEVTVTIPGGAGTSGIVGLAKASRSSGDITLAAASTSFTAVDTALDLTVPAAAGDELEITLSGLVLKTAGGIQNTNFTAYTRVSGANVNNVAASGASNPVTAWFAPDALVTVSGSHFYTVQSGDVSGGNVTLRLYYKMDFSDQPARTLLANAGAPLQFAVKNLG